MVDNNIYNGEQFIAEAQLQNYLRATITNAEEADGHLDQILETQKQVKLSKILSYCKDRIKKQLHIKDIETLTGVKFQVDSEKIMVKFDKIGSMIRAR